MKWPWKREPVEFWPEIEWGRTRVGTCITCKGPIYNFGVQGLWHGGVMDLGAVAYCAHCDTLETVIARWRIDVKEKLR